MLFRAQSAPAFGIKASAVFVEVDLGSGQKPNFRTAGLPDTAARENGERVKAALRPWDFLQCSDASANPRPLLRTRLRPGKTDGGRQRGPRTVCPGLRPGSGNGEKILGPYAAEVVHFRTLDRTDGQQ